jgi:hypothetical protein
VGLNFPKARQQANDAEFRRWKLRLTDLLDRVESLGYDVRCGVVHRHFQAAYDSGSDRVWVHDMTETLSEIELIIENYEKYGDPARTRKGRTSWFGEGPVPPKASTPAEAPVLAPATEPVTVSAPTPLAAPEKVTIGWMIHNVAWKGWTALGSLFALVAVGAYNLGHARLLDDAGSKLAPVTHAMTVPPTPSASAGPVLPTDQAQAPSAVPASPNEKASSGS